MQRFSIVGSSGSGKTSLARRLARALDIPHLELDALNHQPGWTELPTETFRERVAQFCAGEAWVTCGNYGRVRDLVWARADLVVFLDHNRVRQTARVVKRTVKRSITREELWNGNREPLRALWPVDRERSIIRWTWDNVPVQRERMRRAAMHPARPDLPLVRLRGWGEVERFFADVTAGGPTPAP